MIAILGATGKLGNSTACALRRAGAPVRAIVRDAAKAEQLRAIGCAVAVADVDEPGLLARALAGASAVQVILPTPPRTEPMEQRMRRTIESLVEALAMARPAQVLAISDYGAHVERDIGMPSVFRRFEQRLRELPMAKVFLRSSEHLESWARAVPVAAASGMLPSFHQPIDAPFPTVSAVDVGIVAAQLLLRTEVDPGTHVVHAEASRRYSAHDVARALSQLLGREVTAAPVPRAQWQQTLERRLDPSGADLIVRFFDACNAGGTVDVEPGGEVRHGTTDLIEVLRPYVPNAVV